MAENSNRGFGAMNDQQQREIASKGGQSSKGNQGGNSSDRGFASMDPDEQRRIASEGGKASHEQGTGHEWNSEEAREAGRKGGQH
jgi:general stress protein YciG